MPATWWDHIEFAPIENLVSAAFVELFLPTANVKHRRRIVDEKKSHLLFDAVKVYKPYQKNTIYKRI